MFAVHYKSGVFTGIGKNKSDTFHPSSSVVTVILPNLLLFPHSGEKILNFPKRKFRQRENKLT